MSRKVLIIKPSSLGDVANALAAIPAVRALYPGCVLHWLVNAEYEELVRAAGVDDVLRFERGMWRGVSTLASGIGTLCRLHKALRRARYDTVIDLQGLFRSGWFAWMTGAAVRLGFSDARECASLFYTHVVDTRRHFVHAVDACMAAVRALGGADVQAAWEWPGLAAVAGDVHEAAGTKPGGYVVLVPGARHGAKRWPAESYADVAARIWKGHGIPLVLVGAADEEELCAHVKRAAVEHGCDGSAVLPLAGRVSLAGLVTLCRDSRLVVSNDTGALHLAVASGASVVAVMGPTRREGHGPYGQMDHVVAARKDCAPCQGTRRRSRCTDEGACMRTITVESVMGKADALLR